MAKLTDHILSVVTKGCAILAGCSAITMGVSLVYTCIAIIINPNKIPEPTFVLVGVLGILAAMLIYVGAHVIAGRRLP